MTIPHIQRLTGLDVTLGRVWALMPHEYDIAGAAAKYNEIANGDADKYPAWYFTSPGTKVKGAIHTYCLSKGPSGLELSNAFVKNAQSRGSREEFEACFNWQSANLEGLINPPSDYMGGFGWRVFYENSIADPSRRVPDFWALQRGASPGAYPVNKGVAEGRPLRLAGIGLAYPHGKDPNTTQNHSNLAALEEDCDLVVHGEDKLLWAEVRGCSANTSGAPQQWCALCGRALGLTGCAHCNYLYRDNGFDCGGGPPIWARVQKLVEERLWLFAEDPSIARLEWAAEMAKYQKSED